MHETKNKTKEERICSLETHWKNLTLHLELSMMFGLSRKDKFSTADVAALDIELAAEEAVPEFPCDYWEFKGKILRVLNVHDGRLHKADGY